MDCVKELKTWPGFFHSIVNGTKTFEVRKNDRDFRVGDEVLLREWNPVTQTYTGRTKEIRITYLMQGEFGLPEDICVFAFKEKGEIPNDRL